MDSHELAGRVLSFGARVVSGISVRWVNCQPSTRQRIYFGNHSSHLDFIILWSSLPREIRRLTRPAAAHDYWNKNAIRRYLGYKVFNVIMIQRAGHGAGIRAPLKVIDDTLAGMGDKYSLIIFPEGTRGDGEKMAPFKGGLYQLARNKPDIEMIPVFMENLNRILPKGQLIPIPLLSSISFGAPLVLEDNENKKVFLERARQAVLALKEPE